MRPYWKGYLKLALVSCPIALHAACQSHSLRRRPYGHPHDRERSGTNNEGTAIWNAGLVRESAEVSNPHAPHDLAWHFGCIWSICPLFCIERRSVRSMLARPSESGRGEDFRAPHPVGWLGTP